MNKYLIGNNLELLQDLNDESIQLIYMDPPYSTGRDFGDFIDKFDSIKLFAHDFLKPRLVECKRILKNNGNIVIHIEPRISAHVRIALDEVFNERNFRNEIVWKSGGNKKSMKQLSRFHDTILVYSKTSTPLYNPLFLSYDDDYIKKTKICEVTGKRYTTSAAHCAQPNVIRREKLRYIWNGHYKQWYCNKALMQERHDAGALEYNKKGIPRFKKYMDDMDGIPIRDLWMDINQIQSGEKLDYATQKPVKLLERIIQLYSNTEDIILDPFAGSGTTGRACIMQKRAYILFDINQKGKNLFEESIKRDCTDILDDDILEENKPYTFD